MFLFRQEVHAFLVNHGIERGFTLESRQQLLHRSRIEQCAGQAVLSGLASLLEHVNIFFRELRLGMPPIVIVDQLRKPKRTGHASRTATDNDYVGGHFGMFDVGERFAKDQCHGLMVDRCRTNEKSPRNLFTSVWSAVTKSQ